MTLPDRRRTAPGARQGFDLSDLLPANLELSSLKKSDWRKLFERLIAELSRRRGMTTNPGLAYGSMVPGVGMVPMPDTHIEGLPAVTVLKIQWRQLR